MLVALLGLVSVGLALGLTAQSVRSSQLSEECWKQSQEIKRLRRLIQDARDEDGTVLRLYQ